MRSRLLAAVLLLCVGCHGYYPTWHYTPSREVHAIHLGAPETADASNPAATVTVRIVGILRPEAATPRRVHLRFEIENQGNEPLVFRGAATRLLPSGSTPLPPEEASDLALASGERRATELFFRLPDPPTLSNQSLLDVEVAWTLAIGGKEIASRARFERGSEARRRDPWWYDDPYGPRWPMHGGFFVGRPRYWRR